MVMLFITLPARLPADPTARGERAAREEFGIYSRAGTRDRLAKQAHDRERALRQAEARAIGAPSEGKDVTVVATRRTNPRPASRYVI